MANHFIGSMVSIDCGEVLGMYQGLLDAVDTNTQALTIVQPFHNGMKCQVPKVTIAYVYIFHAICFCHSGGQPTTNIWCICWSNSNDAWLI